MKEITKKILNDPVLIENRDAWFEKLRQLFDGDGCGPVGLNGTVGSNCGNLCRSEDAGDAFYGDVARTLDIDFDTLAERAAAADIPNRKHFVPCVVEADFYGVHFVDLLFGADVFYKNGQWNARYLPTKIGELKHPDIAAHPAWKKAEQYALHFLDADVSLPLLGMPVLSSPLNIAVNLYGGEFLVAMLLEPEAAKHDLRIIADVIMELHRWYLTHIPLHRLQPTVAPWRTQPVGFGQICGCSTHLVSPQLYEEFIMPLDDEILGLYPGGGMIHLCGSHSHLVPLFAKMPHLRSVQLNDLAADQLESYCKGLRQDQVIYFSPTEKMPLEKCLEVSAGRKMVLVGDFDF